MEGVKMKRMFFFAVLCVAMLATVAGAQLMSSGNYWPYSSNPDGVIPYVGDNPPMIDGVIDDAEKEAALDIWWSPSIITIWGDTYGYTEGPDYTPDRLRIGAAGDLENTLAIGDDEDASEKGTDADWSGHFYMAWDEDFFYIAQELQDNVYDIIHDAGAGEWAFWTRDGFFLEADWAGTGGTEPSPAVCAVMLHPMNMDEAVYSIQSWGAGEEGDAGNHMYGMDPAFFQGSELAGGPVAGGHIIEAALAWDMLLRGAPELKASIKEGHTFRMWLCCPDPDGGDGYGQTFWGRDYSTQGTGDRDLNMAQLWLGSAEGTVTAVQSSTWGQVKSLLR
jgi:hypothetical protein